MKANEFVKKRGWGEAKSILEAKSFTYRQLGLFSYINHDLDNLKRLIKSHELVESYGGLYQARKVAHKNCFEYPVRLLQAIADVESCQ